LTACVTVLHKLSIYELSTEIHRKATSCYSC